MNEIEQINITQELNAFTCQIEIAIQWSDMDAARHVNNTIYLRWAETARIALFYQLQIGRGDPDRNIGMILGWQECKYIFPVTFPDTVSIGVRVTDVGDDRFMLECHTYSQKNNRLATISKQRIVSYDYQALSKVELPNDWRERLLASL
ncbi:MAG: thioesterase family protein [Chloroflexota bacterium]